VTTSPSKRRPAGRPAGGSDAIVRAVLDATLAELGASGYERLRVEDVAAAAGMNKTSVYRRWATKAELVLAAVDGARDGARPFRETGDLRADLVALLLAKVRRVSTPRGRAIGRALFSIDADDPVAAAIRARRYSLPTSVVQRAIERGELARDVDPAFVSELLLAPVLHRLFVTNESVGRAFVERVVDHVLHGVRRPARRR
jgi:AcrR family transcriptional regulator